MILEPCTSSGSLAVGTDVVIAAPALMYAVTLCPAAAASSVIVYDNATTNSGTVVAQLGSVASGASSTIVFPNPIYCAKGITAVVAGSSAIAIVHYTKSY